MNRPLRHVTLVAALALAACAGPQRRPDAPIAADDPADAPPASAGADDGELDGDADERADDAFDLDGEDGGSPEADRADRPTREPRAAEQPVRARLRARILAAARRRLGARTKLDCSGYVLEAYRAAGVTVHLGPGRSRSEALFHASRAVDRPRPGDLAFFHDTYDRNHDGKGNDRFTHVALVETVNGSEVTLLHRGGRVERVRMDVDRPSDPERNDPVRLRRPKDGPRTRYLAGELFAAFGALLEGDFTQMLQAGRTGETVGRHPATR